jgi:hypothetical protein
MSLDQVSAYYYVQNPYIYYVLHKFGFGMTFIRNIRTVYCNAQLMKWNEMKWGAVGTNAAPLLFTLLLTGVRYANASGVQISVSYSISL